ncbi:hypothetical protein F3J37_01630 [Pantoea sp. Al-1710]|uniref:Effector protein n=1 Tax=Candidatus Pantoea communis TaxID=2608354 RepID=A0ABX0RNB4_9GAMM|nr:MULTISPECIES: M91 family zinc metallopeptidase [Pantoea]NIG12920.1 hypothetical protein [Pantoea sp. Cy-640]NIG17379.1 hypothetical protein [Pantoea communis]
MIGHNYRSPSDVLYNTHIYCNNRKEYEEVEKMLTRIKEGGTNGYNLIYEICRYTSDSKDIHIKVVFNEPTSSKPFLNDELRRQFLIPDDENNRKYKLLLDLRSRPNDRHKRGDGVSCEIRWNPSESRTVDPDGIGTRIAASGLAFISLAHELIHAYHYVHGTHLRSNPNDPFTELEEDRAIGILDFRNNNLSENGIRRDFNLPQRSTRYDRNESQSLCAQYLPNE